MSGTSKMMTKCHKWLDITVYTVYDLGTSKGM